MSEENNKNGGNEKSFDYNSAEFMTSSPTDFVPLASGCFGFFAALLKVGFPPNVALELCKQYLVAILNFSRMNDSKGEEK